MSSRADVVSGRIEHQHDHVDHTVAGQSFCAVHPRHQKFVGGGHDAEAKQVYIALVQFCTRWQEVGDQLGESAKPRPSLLVCNGPPLRTSRDLMRAFPGFFSNERVIVSIIARAPSDPPLVLSIAAAQPEIS